MIISLTECVVPENIHTSTKKWLFSFKPSYGNFQFNSPPPPPHTPSEIPMTILGVGMDIFWISTMLLLIYTPDQWRWALYDNQ